MDIFEQAKSLADEALNATFWEAATHLETTDLVLRISLQTPDHVRVLPRAHMLTDEKYESLRFFLQKPAREVERYPENATVYWLLVYHKDGGISCFTLTAHPVQPGIPAKSWSAPDSAT